MKLTAPERERLLVVDAEYTVESQGHETDEPIVHLFCRDSEMNRRRVDVEGFRPYFYVSQSALVEEAEDIIHDRHIIGIVSDFNRIDLDPDELEEEGNIQVFHDESTATTLEDEPLVQIFTIEPKQVGKIRDYWDQTYEADVPFERRFLISSGITRGIEIPKGKSRVRYENWQGHSTSRAMVQEIQPSDPPSVDPRMMVVDIEVETLGGGVPDPARAPNQITAITAYDNYTEEYYGWFLRSDEWDGVEESHLEHEIDDRIDIEMGSLEIFEHETKMMESFNVWVRDRDFDIVSGWNSGGERGGGFDYPYIIQRSYNISSYTVRDWSDPVLGNPGAWRDGEGEDVSFKLPGLVPWDMLESYKKTQFRDLESYSLEHVASEELGIGKAELEGDYDDAWHYQPIDFIVYNVRDVQAVVQIEQEKELLTLYDNLREVTGALYNTCNHNGPMLDTLFLRHAYNKDIALTTNYAPDQGDYPGAKVFDPKSGVHDTVVYPDLASLYPYILWTLNISPETMYTSLEEAADAGWEREDLFSAYIDTREWKVMSSGETVNPGAIDKDTYKGVHDETGGRKKRTSVGFDGIFEPLDPEHPKSKTEIFFVKPDRKEGFIRETVDELVELKYRYKGQGVMYDAVKRVTNSLYGVLGDSASGGVGFRLFDWRLAESITNTGRMVIEYTAEKYVDLIGHYATDAGYDDDVYLVGGDTDSVMTAIPCAPDYQTALKWSQMASEAFQTNEDGSPGLYDEFMEEQFNVIHGEDEHKMDVEIESLASGLFFMRDWDRDDEVAVKKRYAQHEIWDEDDGWLHDDVAELSNITYDDYDSGVLSDAGEASDNISIKGFEYVRSDSATVTKESQLRILTDILLADEPIPRIDPYLNDLIEDVKSGKRPPEDIGRPKGISNDLDDYGWKTTDELEADTNYTVTSEDEQNGGRYVATPGPTYRGHKYAVDHFDWVDESPKPIRLYVDSVRADAGYPDVYQYDTFPKDDRPDPPEVGRPVDAIALDDPSTLPDGFELDTEKMIEKELEDKIEPILKTIGSSWDGVVGDGRQVGLDAF